MKFTNEQLVGRAIADRRDRVILATKFGNVRTQAGGFVGISGKPDYVHQACDASLQRLGVDVIDLYYQHRVDPTVAITRRGTCFANRRDDRGNGRISPAGQSPLSRHVRSGS
ncbi:aldo/keto reductase [Phormidesmis priestleyi]